VSSDRK
jgi:hypothetical protein